MRQEVLIFSIALLVRLVHIWQLRESPFFSVLMGDSRQYDEWAQRLAGGDWIGAEVFYQAPLYPYFLAVLYSLFDRDLLIVRVVQAILGSGACVLLGLAGTRLFSPRVGVLAALMMALYAPAIFLDALIQKSVVDVFLICLTLWLVSGLATRRHAAGPLVAGGGSGRRVVATTRRGLGAWLGLGAALGGLSLTRENGLVLVAVVLGWALITEWRLTPAAAHRPRFAGAITFLLGFAIVVTPVVVRNQIVGDDLYLTTSQFGPNFYIGNNPRADGTYMSLREGRGDPTYERRDATELAEHALGRRLSPAEVSAFWRDRALEYVTSEPANWLALVARKVMLLGNATEMLDTEAQESHAEWSTPLQWTGYIGHFGVLLPLACFGMLVTWNDRRRLSVVYAMAAGYAASVLLFFVLARYRYPLVPFMMLFAAAGIAEWRTFRHDTPRRRQLAVAGVVVAAAAFTQWPVLTSDVMRAITETNLGVALQAHGNVDEAVAHYRRAVAISPDYAPAYNNLGVALRAQGKLEEAVTAYRQALERRYEHPDVHYNLATALVERGAAEDALSHFRIARESLPPTAGMHNNFGVALATAGRRDEAIAEFRQALVLEPDSTTTRRNLGDALARQRRYPEALEHFRRIAELDAGNAGAHYDLGNVLMEAGRLPEAATEYRLAIRLAPDSAQAHTRLGVALAAQGAIDEAIVEFQQALKLKPDFVEAQRYLTMALQARRR